MSSLVIKSYLAPQADKVASTQLEFLALNFPFTLVINNYKSNFVELNFLRSLVLKNNGFSYHPNKNVKTRAFKGFSTVLSPSVLNGLVVFAFFKEHSDFLNFLNFFKSSGISNKLSYFSILLNGHVVTREVLLNSLFSIPRDLALIRS